MATLSIHTLFSPETPAAFVESHRYVTSHYRLPVNYTRERIALGDWMDFVLKVSKTDVVLFIGIDCVPTTDKVVSNVATKAMNIKSFCGAAQVAKKDQNRSHIYAGPSFLSVCVDRWQALGSPSMVETQKMATAQALSVVADKIDLQYLALYPECYEHEGSFDTWQLGNFGTVGNGTYYSDGIYCLFDSSKDSSAIQFAARCIQIAEGTFSQHIFRFIPCRQIG